MCQDNHGSAASGYQDVEHSQIIFYGPNTSRICSCNVEQDWPGLRHCDDEFSKYPYPIVVESHIDYFMYGAGHLVTARFVQGSEPSPY